MNGCVIKPCTGKTGKRKQVLAGLLAVLVCVVTLFGHVTIAKAAEEEPLSLLEESGVSEPEVEKSYSFTVPYKTNLYLAVAVSEQVDLTWVLCDSAGTELKSSTVSAASWQPYETDVYGMEFSYPDIPAGDYVIKTTFHGVCTYGIAVIADKVPPTISQSSATLTAGFTLTLKVDNTDSDITWSSSKKDIATVNSKGVVTGKAAGTTTITAKVDGQKLTCKVKVKENKFTQAKLSISDIPYGNGEIQVYKAVYESNGDLTLKCRFLNNSGYKVNAFKDFKIVMKDANGKKIGTYSAKTKKITVAAGAVKDFTVTIKKSKLKNKKADLRSASYTRDGKFQYQTYY